MAIELNKWQLERWSHPTRAVARGTLNVRPLGTGSATSPALFVNIQVPASERLTSKSTISLETLAKCLFRLAVTYLYWVATRSLNFDCGRTLAAWPYDNDDPSWQSSHFDTWLGLRDGRSLGSLFEILFGLLSAA